MTGIKKTLSKKNKLQGKKVESDNNMSNVNADDNDYVNDDNVCPGAASGAADIQA